MVAIANLLDPIWSEFAVQTQGSIFEDLYAAGNVDANAVREISQFVKAMRITDSINEAARRLEITVDQSLVPNGPIQVLPLSVGTDFHVFAHTMNLFTGAPNDMERIFYGRTFATTDEDGPGTITGNYTAYDPLTWWARDEGVEVFKDQTLSAIVNTICDLTNMAKGSIRDTEVTLGQIVMGPGQTWWSTIQEAVKRHYRKTGERLFIRWNQFTNAADMLLLGFTGQVFHLTRGVDGSILSRQGSSSAEELRTHVRLIQEQYDGDGNVNRTDILNEQSLPDDDKLVRYFGDMLKIISPDNSSPTPDENAQQVTGELRQVARIPNKLASVTLPLPGIRRGDRVRTGGSMFPLEFYVETAVQEWSQDGLKTSLDLVFDAADVSQ